MRKRCFTGRYFFQIRSRPKQSRAAADRIFISPQGLNKEMTTLESQLDMPCSSAMAARAWC